MNLNATDLEKPTGKELDHGWVPTLTIELVRHINSTGVSLLGVADKFQINEKWEHHTKRCVTHDFYYPGPSGLSVYNRSLKDNLQPCLYGLRLLRILHMIKDIRIKWPSKRILIEKTDLGAAYCRIHTKKRIASTCIAIVDNIYLLCLRLNFITMNALEDYNTAIKSAIKLGNNILRDKSWDTTEIQSPRDTSSTPYNSESLFYPSYLNLDQTTLLSYYYS